MIKTFSMKKDGDKHVANNFIVREFACKDGSDKVLIDTELAYLLQRIRDHFSKPVIITSAYRSEAYNKKIGGVKNSRHLKGSASDICISTVPPAEIAKYAEFLMPTKGGIGLYDCFVHIDTRENRSRWKNYGTEVSVSGFAGYREDGYNMSSADAIAKLTENGIITNPDIWYRGTWTDEDFKHLIIKTAMYIKEVSTK